jgi:hypothetical protein
MRMANELALEPDEELAEMADRYASARPVEIEGTLECSGLRLMAWIPE